MSSRPATSSRAGSRSAVRSVARPSGKNLKGYRASGARRYPANIREWINVAAVGDYISHDRTVRDDYRAMLEHGLIESIEDRRIFNLAIRHGQIEPPPRRWATSSTRP